MADGGRSSRRHASANKRKGRLGRQCSSMGCIVSSTVVLQDVLDLDRTGEELVAALDPVERAYLCEKVEEDNLLKSACNNNTRWFIKLCQLLVDPTVQPSTTDCGAESLERKKWDAMQLPIGGLTFIKEDEDVGQDNRVVAFATSLNFTLTKEFPWDEDREDLTYFSSREEAVISCSATFGKILPAQFNTWPTIESDKGMAELCTAGLAQMFLRAPSHGQPPYSRGTRMVPDNTVVECNLEHMGKYETRLHWALYGATVFLGTESPVEEGSPPPQLHELKVLGVYTCEQEKTLTASDAGWEHAKALFRSSLITDVTLKHHLGNLHWIVANGLSAAAREATEAGSPLRRLLKPHYYRTSAINAASMEMLFPAGQFAHRTFALQHNSWLQYFKDVFAEWRYHLR